MATKKAPKKFEVKKDAKAEAQQTIQSAINSNYSLLIPCASCEYIYVRNPLDLKIKHFSCNRPEFYDYIKYLAELGLWEKIMKDFQDLAKNVDRKWAEVAENLRKETGIEQLSEV